MRGKITSSCTIHKNRAALAHRGAPKNLLNKKDITQKEIDDAKTKIDESKNGLVLVEKTNYISIIIGILFGVIMLVFFAYVIHRFLRDPMFKQNIVQHGLLKALFMKTTVIV